MMEEKVGRTFEDILTELIEFIDDGSEYTQDRVDELSKQLVEMYYDAKSGKE